YRRTVVGGGDDQAAHLLLFGEEYAVTMGLNIRRSRGLLFLSTTLLAGTVTAFCGPIGFIGLAMPHVTRMLFRNSDHRVLVPGTVLSGAAVLLLCDLVSKIVHPADQRHHRIAGNPHRGVGGLAQ
ncbi:Bacterial transport system permease protein, partial [human gut metagenome]